MKKILTAIALSAALLCGCGGEEKRVDVAATLRNVSRLDLASMSVGKVGMISDPEISAAKGVRETARAMLNAMKVGTRIGVYSYDTYVTAYIDLSELRDGDVAVDEEHRKVRVVLPPVRVTVDGRDPRLIEEHVRISGLRSSITPRERALLKGKMAAEVRKEISSDSRIEESLKASARLKGKTWLASLLSDLGYEASIEFRNS